MLGVYSHLGLFAVGYAPSLFFPAADPTQSLTVHDWLEKRRAGGKPCRETVVEEGASGVLES